MIGYTTEQYKAHLTQQLHEANQRDFLVDIEIHADCCNECAKIRWYDYAIRKALTEQPLPNPDCTREEHGCICMYLVLPKRDANDRLIPK